MLIIDATTRIFPWIAHKVEIFITLICEEVLLRAQIDERIQTNSQAAEVYSLASDYIQDRFKSLEDVAPAFSQVNTHSTTL